MARSSAGRTAALDGVIVVDLTRGEAGAAASFTLAQFGATVFIVEPPAGLPLRAVARTLPKGEALWAAWHANKRSLAVDLESATGCEKLWALVQRADILIEDCEAEMLRLGLDYENARQLNPSLVYGSLRPWAAPEQFHGQASEIMLQAITGVMAQTGEEDGPPLRAGGHYVAGLSSIYFAAGVMAAARQAHRTNIGSQVRVVEQEVCLSANYGQYHEKAKFEAQTRITDHARAGGAPTRMFANKPFGPHDWSHITVNARRPGHWVALARGMQREDLLSDPRFVTPADRIKNAPVISGIVGDWMAQHTKQEAMAILGGAGVPISAVYTLEEVVGFDDVQASGMISSVDAEDGRPVRVLASPIRMSGSRVPLRRGPRLGEHTDEVCGLPDREPEHPTVQDQADLALSAGPLSDIVICDFTVALAGPTATRGLERLGARVIKIEKTEDPEREVPLILGGTALGELSWAMNQGGKESITINLRTPEGYEVARRLIERADVVVENFGPGTMERLGFDYETLGKINPRVIYASGKGYNPGSAWEQYAAYDPIGQAAAGASSITGHPDRSPIRPSPPWCDTGMGVSLLAGIVAALVQRESTGAGQQLFVSMFDAALNFLRLPVSEYIATGVVPMRNGNLDPNPARRGFCDAVPCLGGGANDYCVVEIDTDEEWQRLIAATGLIEFAQDARFATRDQRYQNACALRDALTPWFVKRTKRQAMDELTRAGVRAASVVTAYDFMQDRTLWGTDTFADFVLSDGTSVKSVAWPVKFSNFSQPLKAGPTWGQHTDIVLTELLGYSAEEIAGLRAAKAI